MKKTNLVTGVLLAAILFGSTAQAALRTWIAQSGDFNTSANWDTGVPVNGDDAQFTNDTAYTVSFSVSPALIASNLFNGQGGAVTLSLGSQTLVVTSVFSVGDSASTVASVIQNGGSLIVTNVLVAGAPTNGFFIVGDSGVGTYVLTNGTVVTTRGFVGGTSAGRGLLTIGGSGILSNVPNSLGTNVIFTVGTGGIGSQMIVTNGGQLVTGPGIVGDGNGAATNAAIIVGSGSVWNLSSNNLQVGGGFNGSGGIVTNNSVVIGPGGMITNVAALFIGDSGAGVSNSLTVNGGALFLTFNLAIGSGAGGQNNALIITNGGQVSTFSPYVGSSSGGRLAIGATSNSVNDSVIITGAGSVWNLGSNEVRVGGDSIGNIYATRSNLLWVTSGGVLTNVYRVFIGDRSPSGFGNKVQVDNGGQMFLSADFRVGSGNWNTNNIAQIGGAGGPGFLSCGTLLVSDAGTNAGNSMLITNGSTVVQTFGNGSTISGVGDGTEASSNSLTVTGAGTVWNAGSNVFEVGFGGAGYQSNNLLLVKDSAIATNIADLRIGDNGTGQFGNSVVVTNHAQLFIVGSAGTVRIGLGNFATSNSLVIVDGSTFSTPVVVRIDAAPNGTGSVFQVGGPGAPANFISTTNVNVGDSVGGYGNLMIVSNAVVNTGTLIVGNNAATTNNLVTVANATWNMTVNALRAIGGESNSMVIGASAVVTNVGDLDWGDTTNSIANTLVVTNGGKLFTGAPASVPFTNNLYTIGLNGGTSNTVIITGLGSVWDAGGTNVAIGQNSGTGFMSSNNTLYVSAGGLATDFKLLEVGPNAGSNSLAISGGEVVTTSLQVFTNNVISFAAGTLETGGTLVQSNLYTGSPFVVGDGVDAATLQLAGGGTGYHEFDSGLVITNGATLTGQGTILTNGNVTVQGTLAPNLGIVISNNLTLVSGAVLNYQLGNPQLSLTTVAGQLTLAGTINATSGAGFAAPDNYVLFTYGTLVNNGLTVSNMPAGYSAVVSNDAPNNRILLVVSVANSNPFVTWQNHYFTPGELGNPAYSGPNADPLGKGMSNTNQFLAGFNPTNAAAYLHIISIAKTNNNADIRVTYLGANGDSTWSPGVAMRTNVLEFTTGTTANGSYTNNFASTGQTNILSGGTGFGVVTNMVDSGGATNKPSRYYRVRVLLP